MFRRDKPAIRALERLEDSCKELQVAVDELKSANKRLELEWVETYDKVRHQLSRMARRGTLDKSINDAEIVDPEATDEPVLDSISQKIHDRRSRGFIGR